MDDKQLLEFMHTVKSDIATASESAKSAHKRIDETNDIANSVNQLAREVARIAEKVEHIADRMDKTVGRIEQGLKEQGARISKIEHVLTTINRNEKHIEELDKRLDTLEKAPADKWNKLTWLIIAGAATAIVAFIAGKIL